jgi:hypothetical protein
VKPSISTYMARIGRRGGLKSRRVLDRADAVRMVQVREARRLYRRFHARCFWSYPEELKIGAEDIAWVAAQLRRHGGSEGWKKAARLCR